jgi:hypothetical protein
MTKRHLGIIFAALGFIGILAVPVLDLLRSKPFGGPVQWAVIGGCALILALGLLLIPLGDRPA